MLLFISQWKQTHVTKMIRQMLLQHCDDAVAAACAPSPSELALLLPSVAMNGATAWRIPMKLL
jgi:hypothetical protein